MALHKRVLSAGVAELSVEDAMESADPKASLIAPTDQPMHSACTV
eukprot:COSAG06_NODE_70239_length_193_cov_22.446809_1_plen_45_part_10